MSIQANIPIPNYFPLPMRPSHPNLSNWLLSLGVITLAVLPLLVIQGDFNGSDGKAQVAITELRPDYKPWARSVIQLPSPEIESLLFAFQAAIGAGIIGYTIGFYKGRQQGVDSKHDQH